MKRTRILPLLAAIAAIVFFPPADARPPGDVLSSGPPHGDYVPGEVLVKYKSRRETSAAQASVAWMGAEIKKSHPRLGIHQVKLSPAMGVPAALQIFRNDPAVAYAEPNYLRYITATTPDDTYFTRLWGLHNTGQTVGVGSGIAAGTPGADIHAPEAWDIAQGGSTVKVAVIDTGVDYRHPDLAGNISPTLRYDFVNDDASPMDANNHGTHVAGTIAAVGNNGTGVAGVSWRATLMPVRAGDAFGVLTADNIAAAIGYAVANGAKIINASYEGHNFSQTEYDAISHARDAGVLFVAAAGNEARDNDAIPVLQRVYPASYDLDNIIAVAATDQDDRLASFSNYGAATVHVAAPGVNIYSTKPARQTSWSTDFSALTGWTTGGTNNTWGLSASTHYSGTYSLAVSPAGNYPDGSNSWAQAPVRDLSTALGGKLEFVFTGASAAGYDYLYVETSTDGTAWTSQTIYVTDGNGHPFGAGIFSRISGSLSQWYTGTVDLGAYDGAPAVYVRFRFTSDNTAEALPGWFIDDIRVTAASSSYTGTDTDYYQYLEGTSMATPHVAGLAALIWGFKPDLTYTQVKSIIMNSVDAESPLASTTVSGGRINAFRALYYTPPEAPGALDAAVASDSAINLTWTDNSPNESGFRIERRPAAGSYAQVAAVAADSVSYGDRGLSGGTTYCYRVAAFNDGGDSGYSPEACAVTSGSPPAGGGGGGCFIATAAFGAPWEGHVRTLRTFRDVYLLHSPAGRRFVALYYRLSPPLAEVISRSDVLRMITRWSLLPWVGMAYLFVRLGAPLTFALFAFAVLLPGLLLWLYRVRWRANGSPDPS